MYRGLRRRRINTMLYGSRQITFMLWLISYLPITRSASHLSHEPRRLQELLHLTPARLPRPAPAQANVIYHSIEKDSRAAGRSPENAAPFDIVTHHLSGKRRGRCAKKELPNRGIEPRSPAVTAVQAPGSQGLLRGGNANRYWICC
jgi:hypothetical protein